MSRPNTLEHHWMPFTANRDFKKSPRMIVRGEGMYYWNDRGDKLVDGVAGLFTCAAGHGRREIAEAVGRQMMELDYCAPFQFGQPKSFELASRVAALTPENLDRVFFTCSGSEAVETAMKVALAYHRARGQGQRTRFVGRERAYHGVNFGGISIGGMVRNRDSFGVGLPGIAHLRHTHLPQNRLVPGQGDFGADLADDLQRLVDLHGADTIAACFVEPIAGSTGILVPPKGYLERLRAICDKHGILLVFDEVITGFGRTGSAFGAQTFGVTPDMMTMAKAITNGNIPMGALACRDEIYETLTEASPDGAIELFHGYTYSAHPVACAAGLATLDIYRDEDLFAQGKAKSPGFLERVFSLKDLPQVVDIRGFGLLAGIDLAPSERPGKRGYAVLNAAFHEGLVLRVTMDTIILSPALIAEDEHFDRIVEVLRKVIAAS